MDTPSAICNLCDQPATTESTDHGNCIYVACSSATCGDFEISNRAARQIADNPERKNVLRDMAVRANSEGKILQIVIASDGALQATSMKRD